MWIFTTKYGNCCAFAAIDDVFGVDRIAWAGAVGCTWRDGDRAGRFLCCLGLDGGRLAEVFGVMALRCRGCRRAPTGETVPIDGSGI